MSWGKWQRLLSWKGPVLMRSRMQVDFAAHKFGKSTQIKPECTDVAARTHWAGKQLFLSLHFGVMLCSHFKFLLKV